MWASVLTLLIRAKLGLLSVCSLRSVRLNEDALTEVKKLRSEAVWLRPNLSGLDAVRRALRPKSTGRVLDSDLLKNKRKCVYLF